MSVEFARHRAFTVDDLDRMVVAGILREDDRVELIDGEIIEMTPVGSRHAACVRRLNALFSARLAGRAVVSVQDPLLIGAGLLPMPDVAVLRRRDDFYAAAHPEAADVIVLVEVADSSVLYDRNVKAQRYAAAGIAEYWLVDLTRDEVVVHTAPTPRSYERVATGGRGAAVPTAALADLGIGVDHVLG